jgi:hypothetical protein
MQVIVHQEVVPWPTANDTEVIHKGEHRCAASSTLGVGPSYACSLILVPGRQADTVYSLWVAMNVEMEATPAIKRNVGKIVDGSTERDAFTGSSYRTRNEHSETDGRFGARGINCRPDFLTNLDKSRSRRPDSVQPSRRSCRIPGRYRLRCCPRKHAGWSVLPLDQR